MKKIKEKKGVSPNNYRRSYYGLKSQNKKGVLDISYRKYSKYNDQKDFDYIMCR